MPIFGPIDENAVHENILHLYGTGIKIYKKSLCKNLGCLIHNCAGGPLLLGLWALKQGLVPVTTYWDQPPRGTDRADMFLFISKHVREIILWCVTVVFGVWCFFTPQAQARCLSCTGVHWSRKQDGSEGGSSWAPLPISKASRHAWHWSIPLHTLFLLYLLGTIHWISTVLGISTYLR